MLTGLENKVAVVTGASKGIGYAISRALSKEGAHLCMVSRNSAQLEKAAGEIRAETGGGVICHAGDVADDALPERVLAAVLERWSTIHILVNNAGGPPAGSFSDLTRDAWKAALAQNLMSVVAFTTTSAPYMKNQKWGRIINISSTIAKEPTPGMVLSATARAGVSAFSKAVASELASFNITINTLCPGGVLTERLHTLFREISEQKGITLEEMIQQSQESIPINRFASPDEIANVATFLASEKSSYITGTTLMVDGGLTKGIF